MIYLLFIAIAAICKACADALFSHLSNFPFKGEFWRVYSNPQKYLPFTKYPANAWHFANSGMIFAFVALPFVYSPLINLLWSPFWNRMADYGIGGILFIVVFNLFYNKVFFKKQAS